MSLPKFVKDQKDETSWCRDCEATIRPKPGQKLEDAEAEHELGCPDLWIDWKKAADRT
jgi:hypothetical protein